MTLASITSMKKKANSAKTRVETDDTTSPAGSKSTQNPQYVSWKRIEILSGRSRTRNEKLKDLQVREQRIQEDLKTEIRNLVQILESHPLRSESVT